LALPIVGEMELVKKLHKNIVVTPKNMTNSTELQIFFVSRFGSQCIPPGSGAPDLQIVSMETDNPANTFKEFATSNHLCAVGFRDYTKKAYGIDFTRPPSSLNENIVGWQE
jgi:hypothetical protein